MIRLWDIWKFYQGRPALRGVTLQVDQGEAVLLSGPSGAGKSIVLALLYAAETPDRGTVAIAGRDLGKLRRSSLPYVRRNLGIVPQEFRLLLDRTVLHNVALASEVLGLSEEESLLRAKAALQAVELAEFAQKRPRALSLGIQQRIALARAICSDPAILLCDEPTAHLDPPSAKKVLDLLESIHKRGTTLLIATHDPAILAFGLGHGYRRAEMAQGQVRFGGLPVADARSTESSVELSIEIEAEAEEPSGTSIWPMDDGPWSAKG